MEKEAFLVALEAAPHLQPAVGEGEVVGRASKEEGVLIME